jgi:hypothetical protein
MSMELHILSDRQLNSVAEWQRAIDAQGFPLRLASDVLFATASGLLPATLENNKTGFECYHDDAMKTMRFLGVSNFSHFWKYAPGLRWGADFSTLEAAWMAATAYAAATAGIIFDHEEGRVFTPQQGRELVAKFVSDRPRIKAFLEDIERQFSKKP